MADILVPKSSKIFHCELCNFVCSRESQYTRHTNTRKHKQAYNRFTKIGILVPKSSAFICECGNNYNHRQSLSKHKKKCSIVQGECKSNTNNIPTTDIDIDKELLIKMLLKNQEVMDKMIEMMSNR